MGAQQSRPAREFVKYHFKKIFDERQSPKGSAFSPYSRVKLIAYKSIEVIEELFSDFLDFD